jgi:hypothetical protein
MGLDQIDSMVEDVFSEFTYLNEVDIKKALRNGGMGLYGKTYKLTTQEICIWIRTFLNENSPQNIGKNFKQLALGEAVRNGSIALEDARDAGYLG